MLVGSRAGVGLTLCSLLNSPLRKQVSNARGVVSPLWRGQGFVLNGILLKHQIKFTVSVRATSLLSRAAGGTLSPIKSSGQALFVSN